MRIKLYERLKSSNEKTEGLLVKVLKIRLTGIEIPIFEARLRGDSFYEICGNLGVEPSRMKTVEYAIKQKVRDYKKETKRLLEATEREKNYIEWFTLLWQLERYEGMTREKRKEIFGVEKIPEDQREEMKCFLKMFIG